MLDLTAPTHTAEDPFQHQSPEREAPQQTLPLHRQQHSQTHSDTAQSSVVTVVQPPQTKEGATPWIR